MAEGAAAALATPGLVWMLLTIAVAGVVCGFTGFGTAMILMPVATRFVPAAEVIAVLVATGIAASAQLVPPAWRMAHRGEVGRLLIGALVAVPAGVWLLARLDLTVLRWVVAAAAAVLLILLVRGWRWPGRPGVGGLVGIGAGSGLLGGLTGLTGPPVILFYLSGPRAAAEVRANTILYLNALNVVVAGNLAVQGLITTRALWLAAVMAPAYLLAMAAGQAAFAPGRERGYRNAAYGVIALAILSGLPVFD